MWNETRPLKKKSHNIFIFPVQTWNISPQIASKSVQLLSQVTDAQLRALTFQGLCCIFIRGEAPLRSRMSKGAVKPKAPATRDFKAPMPSSGLRGTLAALLHSLTCTEGAPSMAVGTGGNGASPKNYWTRGADGVWSHNTKNQWQLMGHGRWWPATQHATLCSVNIVAPSFPLLARSTQTSQTVVQDPAPLQIPPAYSEGSKLKALCRLTAPSHLSREAGSCQSYKVPLQTTMKRRTRCWWHPNLQQTP